MAKMLCLALAIACAIVPSASAASTDASLEARLERLEETSSKEIHELKAKVERLEETSRDDEPGEIRVFGIDSCPSGYEQVNATKGAVLMSKPDGGHALDKRLLASAK